MKLNENYLKMNAEQINDIFYAECLSDSIYSNSIIRANCYKSIIYKFSKTNKEIIFERPVVDIDRAIVYIEEKIKLTDEDFRNFKIIGGIYQLIDYIEN